MKDERESDVSSGKRPYTKPAVTKVPLIPEEAVLGACKSSIAKGPVQKKCSAPIACRTIGS